MTPDKTHSALQRQQPSNSSRMQQDIHDQIDNPTDDILVSFNHSNAY